MNEIYIFNYLKIFFENELTLFLRIIMKKPQKIAQF